MPASSAHLQAVAEAALVVDLVPEESREMANLEELVVNVHVPDELDEGSKYPNHHRPFLRPLVDEEYSRCRSSPALAALSTCPSPHRD